MLIESVLLLTLLALLMLQYIRRQWNILNEWNIPHEPPSLRNFGHARLMFGKNTVEFELRCKKKFGNVWGWYMLTRPRIVFHDPEIVRYIMIKDFASFQNRFLKPEDIGSKYLAGGLIAADGEKWKRMRSTLSPMFSSVKLKAMSTIVTGCIANLSQRLKNMNKNIKFATVDVKDLFNRLSLDVICSVVFSIDVNSQDDTLPEPQVSKKAKLIFKNPLSEKIQEFVRLSFPFMRKYIGEGSFHRRVSDIAEIVQKMIESRAGAVNRSDILEMMVNARKGKDEAIASDNKGLIDSEITNNAITMLLAGYETTGAAMTYFAYNLAFQDDIQRRLQSEIDNAFGGKEIDYDTASKLKYLDMCLNESLRLYCPIGRTIRVASRDVTVSGVRIRKSAVVNVPLASLCRDPDFWQDPTAYRPERMKEMHSMNSIIYQPFGNGPRNCVGMKFAIMEIKLAFCTILRDYTIKPAVETPKPPLVLKQFMTTSPVQDINLEIIPRR